MLQSYLALLAGAVSICLQAVGLSTDFWLHTQELMVPENVTDDWFIMLGRDCQVVTKWYSGLWRICPDQGDLPEIVCYLPPLLDTGPEAGPGGGLPMASPGMDPLPPPMQPPPITGRLHPSDLEPLPPPPHDADAGGRDLMLPGGSGNGDYMTGDDYYDYMDEGDPPPIPCDTIQYYTVNTRIESVDATTSILRGMRFSTPFHVVSLLLLVISMILLVLGHVQRDRRTVIGAILMVVAGLLSAIGIILYILAISNELSHRPKPKNKDEIQFRYWFGWSFFFVVAAFIVSQVSAVAHVSVYLRRFPSLDLMSQIIPGLARKAALQVHEEKYPEHEDVLVTVTL